MPDQPLLLRSFIALPLSLQTQQQIAALQRQLRSRFPALKTPRAENLHLTLHFLGDQPQELLAKVGQLMLSIGQKKKNFNLTLKGLGFFPHQRRPRILWLGVAPEVELQKIQQQLGGGLTQLGVETDQRPYRPHLTIGRFRKTPAHTDSLCPFLSQKCSSLNIDRMVLYTSELTPRGAVHTPFTTAMFGMAED